MSERIPASITIGGEIKRKTLEALVEFIGQAGVGLNYGESHVDPKEAMTVIMASQGSTVRFCDDQASWGLFNDLETFCRKNKVDFDRHSDGRGEFPAAEVFCRSGVLTEHASNNDEDIVVGRGEVLYIIDGAGTPHGKLKRLRKLLWIPPALATIVIIEPKKGRKKSNG